MSKPLLTLIDDNIIDITSDESYSPGCETCDYGSSYTRSFNISFEKDDDYIEISKRSSYDYKITLEDILAVLLNHTEYIKSLTKKEFAKWIYLAMCKKTKEKLELSTNVLTYKEEDKLFDAIESLEEIQSYLCNQKDFSKLIVEGYELDE